MDFNGSKDKSVYTAVLYSKEDAVKFLEDQPEVRKLYPLTPDARAELLGKTDLPLLDPLIFFSDYSHKRLLSRVRRVERKLLPLIEQADIISEASKETFRGSFHLLACSVYYAWYLLRFTGPWLYYSKKTWPRKGIWEKYDSLFDIHRLLIQQWFNSKIDVYNLAPYRILCFKRAVSFVNKLLIKIILKRNCVWITDSKYGLINLKQNIFLLRKKYYVIKLSRPRRTSILYSLLDIVKVVFFRGNQELKITPVPSPISRLSNFTEKLLKELNDDVLKNASHIIHDVISNSISYTESIVNYTDRIFGMSKCNILIAHQVRWLDGAVIAEAAKKNNSRVVLVSHGSHTVQSNSMSFFEQKENARGLLFSPLATETITQSPNAHEAAISYMPEVKRKKFMPIMWGDTQTQSKKNKKSKEKIILHAGTFKNLCARPWIYETSNEFVYGIKLLIEAVNKLTNTKLIIRIRDNQECGVSTLKKLLPFGHNCEIKTSGQFLNDLSAADLLISYSSTTIEEALYARKPVGLFGGSSRYRHLPGSTTPPQKTSRSAVYHLSDDNLVSMLTSILDSHVSKPLTDQELGGYTWPSNIPGNEAFINHILNFNSKPFHE